MKTDRIPVSYSFFAKRFSKQNIEETCLANTSITNRKNHKSISRESKINEQGLMLLKMMILGPKQHYPGAWTIKNDTEQGSEIPS